MQSASTVNDKIEFLMTDEMTPEEIIAHVLERNYDYPYESFHYVAVDILKDLKYNDMVESILEKDKKIAELKAEIENEYELSAYKWSLE